MPDLYTPLNWNDGPAGGTPASVARGPRRWEAGIEALDVQGDNHDARISALESALVSLAGAADVMTTAERTAIAPVEGKLVIDSDLEALLIGKPGNAGWWKVDLTSLTGAGSATAPVLSGELVAGGTIGEIDLSWTAVGGAAASGGRGPYILYESRSPSGVSGATTLTGTSTSRTPSTTGGYDYWVTAMVGGVETAASNHFTTTLPYVAPGGGGGGGGATGTPAQILNIGSGSTQNYFNCGIGYSTGHVDKTMAQIIAGFAENPYFTPNAAGDAVKFQVFANGQTTSNNTAAHARSELRELKQDGTTKADWNASSGTHTMTGISKCLHLPSGGTKPWITIAQIHDAADDVVRLQLEGTTLYSRTHSPNGSQQTEVKTSMKTGIAIGDDIDWKIEVIGGTCKLYVDNTLKFTMAISGSGMYFKAGCYIQFSTKSGDGGYPSSEYGAVELRNLDVTHS